MPFKLPKYPEELTNAAWQKNKGLLAKASGETGIGDLLKEAVTAYGKVDWAKFNLATAAKGQGAKRTKQDIEDAFKEALKEGAHLKALEQALQAIERKANLVAKEWANKKSIPASSIKVVEEVAKAAKLFNYATTMGTISDMLDQEVKECEESIDKIAMEYTKLNEKLRKYVNTFEAVTKGKVLADYPEIWKENIRGVGTVLPTLVKDHPELKTEWEIWKNFSNSQKNPESEEAFQKQMVMLNKVALSLKPKLAKI